MTAPQFKSRSADCQQCPILAHLPPRGWMNGPLWSVLPTCAGFGTLMSSPSPASVDREVETKFGQVAVGKWTASCCQILFRIWATQCFDLKILVDKEWIFIVFMIIVLYKTNLGEWEEINIWDSKHLNASGWFTWATLIYNGNIWVGS